VQGGEGSSITDEGSSISQIQKFVQDHFNDYNSIDSMKTAVYAHNPQHGLQSSE
jgi:hypothetical protein